MNTLILKNRKVKKNSYRLTNSEILSIYKENDNSSCDKWMNDLFFSLLFVVESRLLKYKKYKKNEDLYQSFCLALWLSIKTFDWHRNFDFYRWLGWHLTKAARDFFSKENRKNSINLLIQSTLNSNFELQDAILLKEIFLENSKLTEKEKFVVWNYDIEGRTLKEIGFDLDVTPERIRQVRDIGLQKIRDVAGRI